MKSAGKRYARWRRIRPHPDPIGDNWLPYFLSKTRAKINNRSLKRQFGCGSQPAPEVSGAEQSGVFSE
jgi:hypothetical protein